VPELVEHRAGSFHDTVTHAYDGGEGLWNSIRRERLLFQFAKGKNRFG